MDHFTWAWNVPSSFSEQKTARGGGKEIDTKMYPTVDKNRDLSTRRLELLICKWFTHQVVYGRIAYNEHFNPKLYVSNLHKSNIFLLLIFNQKIVVYCGMKSQTQVNESVDRPAFLSVLSKVSLVLKLLSLLVLSYVVDWYCSLLAITLALIAKRIVLFSRQHKIKKKWLALPNSTFTFRFLSVEQNLSLKNATQHPYQSRPTRSCA